jgi:hypothetical protein
MNANRCSISRTINNSFGHFSHINDKIAYLSIEVVLIQPCQPLAFPGLYCGVVVMRVMS